MREANYASMNIFNSDQVSEINNIIKNNLIQGKDKPATAKKTSEVKFVNFNMLITKRQKRQVLVNLSKEKQLSNVLFAWLHSSSI